MFEFIIANQILIIERIPGMIDRTCPQASFVRPAYKVVDYKDYPATFPNDTIYLNPVDFRNLKKIEQEG